MPVNNTVAMRDDITGLRSLAVIPVLLFHAKVPFIPGGFLGVDLFFFISGFLITGDVLRKTQSKAFGFISFYNRRARRILPALLFVMLVVTLASPFFMVPYDIKNLGQSLFASAFAVNNILLYITSGYWSLAAEFKPLYHTWSLGVEEQYYFLVPVIFIAFNKFSKNRMALYLFISALIVFSFLYCLWVGDKEYNFLVLFTRAWELMSGGLLAAFMNNNKMKSNNFLSALGLFCIIVSYFFPFFLSENQAIVNLLPILGAFLIVAFSDNSATYTGRILSFKPFVFIGLISYSVYLWHQPLIAFFRLSSEYEPAPFVLTMVSFTSIPLAYLTWRFIENPARASERIPSKLFYPALLVCTSFVAFTGLIMHKSYGFQQYFPEFTYGGDPQKYVDSPKKYSNILTRDLSKERLVVLGNSFARDFINMLVERGLDNKYQIVYEESGCEVSEQRLNDVLIGANHVVLAGNWAQSAHHVVEYDDLYSCVNDIVSRIGGRNLLVVGAKNFGWNNNYVKMLPLDKVYSAKTRPLENVSVFNKMAAEGIPGYVDILTPLTDASGEVNIFTDDGEFITYDTNHLTKSGAKYLGAILFEKTELAILNE
jgi:peptidoglycan/LPS O-acetylase OafA/YrhL